jgi:hypothetical protein
MISSLFFSAMRQDRCVIMHSKGLSTSGLEETKFHFSVDENDDLTTDLMLVDE